MADGAEWRTYLVEHYWPGVTEAAFRRSARSVAGSADSLARDGEPIRFLHSTLVPDDEATYCVLTAASAELVERAYAAAGVGFERLVEAIESEVRDSTPRLQTGSDHQSAWRSAEKHIATRPNFDGTRPSSDMEGEKRDEDRQK